MQTAGYILGRMLLRPYRAMNNFYRERILPMWMAGYILGRMQYAPTECTIGTPKKE